MNQLNYCTKAGGGDVLAPAAILYTLGLHACPFLAACLCCLFVVGCHASIVAVCVAAA